MPRIFITGSSDGLGLAAAQDLLGNGHAVVVHARNERRAADLRQRLPAADAVLVGDLASRTETLRLACRANELGTFDAVIHNAGIGYRESRRIATPEGHAHVLAINVLARALARRPGFAGTVSAVDRSPLPIDAGRRLAREDRLGERIAFYEGDAHRLDFVAASLDVVVARGLSATSPILPACCGKPARGSSRRQRRRI